ncbi:MAG: Tll0287-like domain-containing protein [Nitrospiraceae bacterium]
MKNYLYSKLITASIAVVVLTLHTAAAVTRGEAEETAHLLGVLLSAGRVVIERNQPLIDDPARGDKGFTPAVFEQQVTDEFRARTGMDIKNLDEYKLPPMASALLRQLIEAGNEVVAEAQAVINKPGVGYKNFIPASFGSRVAERFSTQSHVTLKQTTLKPRNPKNAPDAYEEAVLQRLLTQPSPSVTIQGTTDDEKTLRVLTPIYYTKDCLKCHGSPAGSIDISGHPKEGAEEGDLAGAISVSVPLDAP